MSKIWITPLFSADQEAPHNVSYDSSSSESLGCIQYMENEEPQDHEDILTERVRCLQRCLHSTFNAEH